MRRRIIPILLLTLSAALAVYADEPTTAPSATTAPATSPAAFAVTEPTAPQLRAQLWTVLVIDAPGGQANVDGLVHSCMPDFSNDKRFDPAAIPVDPNMNSNNGNVTFINGRMVRPEAAAAAPAAPTTAPSPLTVIRLTGNFDGKFDVSFKPTGSTYFGHWPPAELRTNNELLWRDLTVATTCPVSPTTVPADSVFARLRAAPVPFVTIGKGGGDTGTQPVTERFLAIDMSMNFSSPLKVKLAADGTVDVTNNGKFPLRELKFYRSGRGDSVAFGDLAVPTTQQSSSTQPTTRAALTTQPTSIIADWTDSARAAGLQPDDAAWIGTIVDRFADDDTRLTAVFRLDDAQAAKMFPIEIVPTPKSIDRYVLVVVRNVDPAAKTAVDALITKLGDDDWTVRDDAMHRLAQYGPAAAAKLQGATGNKDPEIAWRAQRLVLMARKQ